MDPLLNFRNRSPGSHSSYWPRLPILRDSGILAAFEEIAARLRGVRVAAGEWDRIVGDSVTWRHGVCGVFLDPPYPEGESDYAVCGDGSGIAHDVRAWAIKFGARPDMRIALCGYDEHEELRAAGWQSHRWKAAGGYGKDADLSADHNDLMTIGDFLYHEAPFEGRVLRKGRILR